jgi:isopenicillin-N epimerase
MNLQHHWQLNPHVDFLNHGSFGATPTVVLEAQRQLQDQLERDPIEFLGQERQLEPKLDRVREQLSRLVHARASDLAFVRNATDGVNAVLRSLTLGGGDEIVVTDHGYNACCNAARFVAERCGAAVRVARVPFPIRDPRQVVEAIQAELTDRTRIVLVDHVTSPTGLVFPIDEIVSVAHRRDVPVLVDGAHAVGMLLVDLARLDADYYTANHHKWLCAPKASGLLYVRPDLQATVRPTVISHGANRARPGRSRFLAEFDWIGTYDPTPLLSVPASIEFLGSLWAGGMEACMSRNRALALQSQERLCETLQIDPPAPREMIGSLVAVPLPPLASPAIPSLDPLQVKLFQQYRIELPIFPGPQPGQRLLRISLQAYNDLEQIERLCAALRESL